MQSDDRKRFGEALLLHLDAAYNLARWLTQNDHAAEDVVQESYCRSLKYYQSFRGGALLPWLLRVVRRTAYDWLAKSRRTLNHSVFDENQHSQSSELSGERLLIKQVDAQYVYQAIARLPEAYREVTVLRDLEGLSYDEIAHIVDIPVGTVMSRLSRGRKQLQVMLSSNVEQEY